MNIEICHSPGSAAAKIRLEGGEKFVAESGAMIAMSTNVQVEVSTRTKGKGGILKGVKRMLGGESFFINTFIAPKEGGDVYLAASLAGDVKTYNLDGSKKLLVQGSSFIGCGENVDMNTTWQGLKSTVFGGESIFWIELSGTGPVIFGSFGGMYERNLQQDYIVDTGHIVAFESTLSFDVQKASRSIISSILSGEGFVSRFSGEGKLFCQTHHANNFGFKVGPFLLPK